MNAILGLVGLALMGLTGFFVWSASKAQAPQPEPQPQEPFGTFDQDALQKNMISVRPTGFFQRSPLSPQGIITASYLKTVIEIWKQLGILKLPLVQETYAYQEGRPGFPTAFLTQATSTVLQTAGSGIALGLGIGSAATAASGVTAGATAIIALIANLSAQEENKIAQAQACLAAVRKVIWDFGPPPFGLMVLLARLDKTPPFEIIEGNGGFDRVREPGPGIIARWIRALEYINRFYIGVENAPFLDTKQYKAFARTGAFPCVFGGETRLLAPSRLAEWSRYACHPYYLFTYPIVPLPKKWGVGISEENHPYHRFRDSIHATQYFEYRRQDMARWLAYAGGSIDEYKGRQEQLPTQVSFEIGHDPTYDDYPAPLLGLAPGDYGSISINANDWRVRWSCPTNPPNSWMIS